MDEQALCWLRWRQGLTPVKPLAGVILFILCGYALAAPMAEPVCDARLVAEHMKALTQAQFVEVVDTLEAQGAIDQAYAAELRAFIKQAYSVPDADAWARAKCQAELKT